MLNAPAGLAVTSDGSVLIADRGANQILRRAPDGQLTVIAGTRTPGYSGDGGPAVSAQLNRPTALAVAPDDTIYPKLIAKFDAQGTLLTVIGRGETYVSPGAGLASGPDRIVAALWSFSIARVTDSGLTRLAGDFRPSAVAVGPDGTIYASVIAGSGDSGPSSVMKIATDGTVSLLVS